MRTLIIPDVHEKIDAVYSILDRMEKDADKVVFLGDWFDSFGHPFDPGPAIACAEFLRYTIHNSKYVRILGNHDAAYRWGGKFRCSGWSALKAAAIGGIMQGIWGSFEVYTKVDDWTISHAGFHPAYSLGEAHAALKLAEKGVVHRLFGAGMARGGSQVVGGCLWLDFDSEFKPQPNMKQIFGHTRGKKIRVNGDNYCLDTDLRHVAILEDGWVTIENK